MRLQQAHVAHTHCNAQLKDLEMHSMKARNPSTTQNLRAIILTFAQIPDYPILEGQVCESLTVVEAAII